jgi:uncharacterized phiE125 gp8 family phage protein
MELRYKIVVPPAGFVLTLAEIKEALKVSTTDEDYLIQTYLAAATEQVEQRLSVCLLTQTIDQYFDRFPTSKRFLELARGPMQSVTAVTYTDANGNLLTWNSSLYATDTISRKPRIGPKQLQTWPLVEQNLNAVKVRFVAGYGGRNSVPAQFKHLILTIIGDWYQHRDNPVQERKTRADYLIRRLKLTSV